MIGPYKTPQAFRVALETRLRVTSQERGVDLQRLQRQVAFERPLARLFADEIPPWLLKGGYSLTPVCCQLMTSDRQSLLPL